MSKKNENNNTEKKNTPKIVTVERQAKVDVGGNEIEVTVKLYAVSADCLAKLELDSAPEFADRKAVQKFINDRRAELRAKATPEKLQKAARQIDKMRERLAKMAELFAGNEDIAAHAATAITSLTFMATEVSMSAFPAEK